MTHWHSMEWDEQFFGVFLLLVCAGTIAMVIWALCDDIEQGK